MARALDKTGQPIPRRSPPAPGSVPLPAREEYGPLPSGRDAVGHQPQRNSRDAKPLKTRKQ